MLGFRCPPQWWRVAFGISAIVALCCSAWANNPISLLTQTKEPVNWTGAVEFLNQSNVAGSTYSRRISLTWTARDRYVYEITVLDSGGKETPENELLVCLPEGKYMVRGTSGRDEMSLPGVADVFPVDDEPLFFVSPRPGLMAGLLLSSGSPTNEPNTYLLGDKTLLMRAEHGNGAVVDRMYDGRSVGTYTYLGHIVSDSGFVLPKKVVGVAHTSQPMTHTVEFLANNVGKAVDLDRYDRNWLKPGRSVMDRRVDPEVAWTYESLLRANSGKTDMSLQELLELSKQRSAYFNAELARSKKILAERRRAKEEADHRILLFGVGSLICGGIAFYFVRKNVAQKSA